MKTIIIGLGNPILGDDAIGCIAAEALKTQFTAQGINQIEIDQFYRGGISLMEHLIGYDQALIIDSVQGVGSRPGDIVQLALGDLPTKTVNSPHDATLLSAVEMGRQLGEKLPDRIDILGVEIVSEYEFSDQLSRPITDALPILVRMAADWAARHAGAGSGG